MANIFSKLIPSRRRKPVVPVVRLQGTIGAVSPLRPGLTLQQVDPVLEKAFGITKAKAIAVTINSPGGSPVQSALIFHRVRQLAEENEKQVLVFAEDVAASGGYMLAIAGDEIYADPSSIIGSIGVVSAGFGFVEAIKKLGIERRVHTAGDNKAVLDPFMPAKKADVERLKKLQLDVHETFKDMVRSRRGSKLAEDNKDLFSGAFWSGATARDLGLIDGLGNIHAILKEKFGDNVVLKPVPGPKKGLLPRLMPGMAEERLDAGTALSHLKDGLAEDILATMEERTVWARYGF